MRTDRGATCSHPAATCGRTRVYFEKVTDLDNFDDLLAANRTYSESFDMNGFDGIAKAGVLMVTCMDSRLDPLGMIGLKPGDAKFLRNPGGRVEDDVLKAIVLSIAALNVDRVLIVEHTRCAMGSSSEAELQAKIGTKNGVDATWLSLDVINDQAATLTADVHKVRSHPLVPENVKVGGFLYDVDTGLLKHIA